MEETGMAPDRIHDLFLQAAGAVAPALLRPAYRAGQTAAQLLQLAHDPPQSPDIPDGLWPALRRLGRRPQAHPAWRTAVEWSAALERVGARVIRLGESAYPEALAQVPDAPLLLYVRGNAAALADPQLAVVGSRRASASGVELAAQFASGLTRAGLTVTSGLAQGIDAAAHEAALAAGGETIAVLGTGIDRVYPPRHRDLARRIADAGLLVSELPPGTPPVRHNFPARNRIIAGMALGVLVVEAARQSGSLITARLAAEYNREVFAVPGSIHHPQARGCHQLLRMGAQLTESLSDILEHIAVPAAAYLDVRADGAAQPSLSDPQRKVLEAIGYEPTPYDMIRRRTALAAGELEIVLLELELAGCLQAGSGCYRRR